MKLSSLDVTMAGMCSIDGCQSPVKRLGLCYGHYMKQWRYGDAKHQPAKRGTDITGRRYGSLVALEPATRGMWLCQCDCGVTKAIRVGDLNRGSIRSCGNRLEHPRKEVITYAAAHDRVEAHKGLARSHVCIDCGRSADHWSYDHTDPDEMHEYDGRYLLPYSTDPQHYDPRCISCHRRFDRARNAA